MKRKYQQKNRVPTGLVCILLLQITHTGSHAAEDTESAGSSEVETKTSESVSGNLVPPAEYVDPDKILIDPYTVAGSKDAAFSLPGSAYYLDTGDIENLNYQNINQVSCQRWKL